MLGKRLRCIERRHQRRLERHHHGFGGGHLAGFLAPALDEQRRATCIVMQVHDELVFEVPDVELDWARTEVPRLMAGVAQLSVPLLAEVGVGANWDEAH